MSSKLRPTPPHDARLIGRGRFLRLLDDNGWEYVHRDGARGVVVIVARTPEGRVLLVQQYRPAVQRQVIELPAGLVGDTDGQEHESLAEAARRELEEETGYRADEILPLAEGPGSVGVSSEIITFFEARGTRKVGPGGGDSTERIVVHEVDPATLRPWLAEREREGLCVDPKIFAGLYLSTTQPAR